MHAVASCVVCRTFIWSLSASKRFWFHSSKGKDILKYIPKKKFTNNILLWWFWTLKHMTICAKNTFLLLLLFCNSSKYLSQSGTHSNSLHHFKLIPYIERMYWNLHWTLLKSKSKIGCLFLIFSFFFFVTKHYQMVINSVMCYWSSQGHSDRNLWYCRLEFKILK